MGATPRMTLPTLKVLKVLLSDPVGEHYGLEIANQANLKSGTIYPILARLETCGWVTSSWEDVDPSVVARRPRRYYQLSNEGAQKARLELQSAAWLVTPGPTAVPRVPDPGLRPGDSPA
jgi:PadR family transcriptional regulator PadR